MAHPQSPYPSKQKASFGTLITPTDPFLFPKNPTILLCFINVSHFTPLVPTLSHTRPTEKEQNFPSVVFPHLRQYELHQKQTPSTSSLIPKKPPKNQTPPQKKQTQKPQTISHQDFATILFLKYRSP